MQILEVPTTVQELYHSERTTDRRWFRGADGRYRLAGRRGELVERIWIVPTGGLPSKHLIVTSTALVVID